MAVISSLGVGSGLDLSSLVTGLLDAERAPAANRLATKEQNFATELSGFGLLRSSLAQFQTSLDGLQSADVFDAKAITLSDTSVFTATAENAADIGNYSIEVTALAKAQSLASSAATAFASVDDVVGTGTLEIQFGTTATGPYAFTPDLTRSVQTIEVSVANNNTTLSGLRDYINDKDNGYDLQASIINDGNGYRLLLTSVDSGADNSMEITAIGDGDGFDNDNAGLSQLAFNASAQTSMIQTVAAEDAALSINGLKISSETNNIVGAVNGVTLDLLKADPGNFISVDVKESRSGTTASVSGFVTAYNALVENIDSLTSYDPETGARSALVGDFTVRSISNQIRNIIFGGLSDFNGNIRSLVDVGITTNSSGTLKLDSSKLADVLQDYPSEVEALFSRQGVATDSGVNYLSATSDTRSGDYAINVTSAATQGLLNGGSGVNNLTIDANNDNLTFLIDGLSSGNLSLTQGVYASAADLASEIQTQINASAALQSSGISVIVAYDGINDRFDITSDQYGSSSSVEITAIDVNSNNDLGFSVGQGVAGIDMVGTIDAGLAAVNGRSLTSLGGNSQGLLVEILSPGSPGARGTISFSPGIAGRLDALLNNFLESDGFIASREESINDGLDDIFDERIKLDVRISSLEARLIRQFSALDALVAQFNQTSNFLSLQLANLPKPNSINNNN
jgi:flagellar hook-associated protein 2